MVRALKLLAASLLLGAAPFLAQCSHNPDEGAEGPWRHRLYTPTYFTKIGDSFVIVDTWHHRILYSESLDPDLTRWKILSETLGGPHSIATDGNIAVYDDTGHGNLRAARKIGLVTFDKTPEDGVEEYEYVFDVGTRPHRVIYDDATESFYSIASGSQEILRVTNELGRLVVQHRQTLDFLNRAYTRSMAIIDGNIFFVTRAHGIIEATYRNDVFEYVRTYPVPEFMDDLNDVFRSEAGWYYVTSTPGAIVRCRSLDDLATENYEYLTDLLGLEGTPYYPAEVEGRIYVPQITQHSGIISFQDSETGPVTDVQVLFDFGKPEPPDEWRKGQFPR
jgi:hypothetical protein